MNLREVTLVLIRHGETEENASGLVQGQRQGRLTETGIEQVRTLASHLRDTPFDALYSSDLRRAVETSRILLEGRQPLAMSLDGRLREQHFGVHEGKTLFSMLRKMKAENAVLSSFASEGGERPEDFRTRVEEFCDEIIPRHGGKVIAVVTHYGVIRAIVEDIFQIHHTDIKIPNAGAVIVPAANKKERLLSMLKHELHMGSKEIIYVLPADY